MIENLSSKRTKIFDGDEFETEDYQYHEVYVKKFIENLKPNFCPMCGVKFDDCICDVPAFSVKWLRTRIDENAGPKLISTQETKQDTGETLATGQAGLRHADPLLHKAAAFDPASSSGIIEKILREFGYLNSPRVNILFARACLKHSRKEQIRFLEYIERQLISVDSVEGLKQEIGLKLEELRKEI